MSELNKERPRTSQGSDYNLSTRYNIARYQYWLRVLCSTSLFGPDVVKSLIQEHCRILNLIQSGEYEEAKHCLRSHMDETWRLMKKNFEIKTGEYELIPQNVLTI